MQELSRIAALGLWPALPITGYWLLRSHRALVGHSALTSLALMTTIGIAVWSLPLLTSAALGVYSGAAFGLIGWIITGLGAARLMRRRTRPTRGLPRPDAWEWVLAAGLAVAAGLYLGFPTEHITQGDMTGYVTTAATLVHHGGLMAPLPWPADAVPIFRDAFIPIKWLYPAGDGMAFAHFGHVFSVWLAQAYATVGEEGLLRLNGVLAPVSLAVFYGLCRLVLPKGYAVAATLFLALNPSQIWLARISMSEILTQMLVLAGLLLLLLALRESDATTARWAGLPLGLSAAVHIDAFFLLPLLFLAHLAIRLVEDPRKPSTPVWLALYQTALPAFALSLGHYIALSGPYLSAHARPVLGIAAAAAACLVLLVALGAPPIARLARPLVASTPALVLAGVLLLGASIYAYWIRPNVPPFVNYPPPLDDRRTYIENTLVNLAQYLSPPVVWGAILGWFVTLCAGVRAGRAVYLVAALVIAGGFAAVYLWNPMVNPIHFWAIRRFVPLIIPAFILFAALGLRWAMPRLPKRPAQLLAATVAVWLLVFTVRAGLPIYAFADHAGYYDQVEEMARRLPEDQPVLATWRSTNTKLPAVLHTIFDRAVIPLELRTAEGEEALKRWTERQLSRGQPAYLLEREDVTLRGLEYERVATFSLSRSLVEPTVSPLPARITSDEDTYVLYRITGAREDVAYTGTELLDIDTVLWGVETSGFYGWERYRGRRVRWTDGSARVTVPLNAENSPTHLRLRLLADGLPPTTVRVSVNGRVLYDGPVTADPSSVWWSRAFPLAEVELGDEAAIELHSGTRTEEYVSEDGSRQTRTLGVPVTRILLTGAR